MTCVAVAALATAIVGGTPAPLSPTTVIVAAGAAPRVVVAVVAVGANDAARAAIEKNVTVRDDVTVVGRKAVDDALAALHDAGIDCGADDASCFVKLGLEGDFDAVLVVSPAGTSWVDVATGVARKCDDSGRVLVDAPAPAPATPTAATPTAATAPPTAPRTTTTRAPAVAQTQRRVTLAHWVLGGIAVVGVVGAVGFGVGVGAVDAEAQRILDDADTGVDPINNDQLEGVESTEGALIAATAIAAAIGAGAAVALFTIE